MEMTTAAASAASVDVKAYTAVPEQESTTLTSAVSPSKGGHALEWNNVCYKVQDKTILKDCWGKVRNGEVCAIMGPSGAGKSSLLNVLAGRSAASEGIAITGNVTVGGTPINPVNFRKNIAYVMQDDALMATQTPEEVLRFSATLRLPTGTAAADIDTLVKKTIVDLGLENCKDVMVGGPMIKGISGGQRKRTSIGIEIITDPELLFRKLFVSLCRFVSLLSIISDQFLYILI